MEPKRKKNKHSQVNILNLVEKANNFVLLSNEPSIDAFVTSISMSNDEIKEIYDLTTSQANSEIWKKQRVGRLTTSKFKNIFTSSKRLQQDEEPECPPYLMESIMNYTNVQTTWQMKHGINTEVHAKAKCNELAKKT